MNVVQPKFKFGVTKNPQVRTAIERIEKRMLEANLPQRKNGSLEQVSGYEVKHSFGEGIYVRECHVPTGFFFVSELHKFDHPYFMMKGRIRVMSEEGNAIIEAPSHGITKAGTKRVVYVEKDTVFCTCHAVGKEKDLNKIEDFIVAKSYDEFELEEKI